MDEQTLKYLLSMPPEQIVRWYQSKGYTFSWNWQDTWQQAHAKAFTVAKAMRLDVLQSIKDTVEKIFTEGYTYDQFRRELEPQLKKLGWWGKVAAKDVPGFDPSSGIDPNKIVQLGSPRRLKTIYYTNAKVAYSSGHYKSMMEIVGERPYWQYKQLERKHRRKEHARYADKIFRYDDPIWDSIYPPNGWNCGCYVVPLKATEVEARGLKVWKGSDVKIDVADGWNYNPGKAAFFPNPNEYDYDVAINWVRGGLTGPDFKNFFDGNNDSDFPVAVLDEQYQRLIKAKTKSVFLSAETLDKNKTNHPELFINDYQNLPTIIQKAQLIVKDSDRTFVFLKIGDKIYYGAIKTTVSGGKNFLTSFRLASNQTIEEIKQRGKVVKNIL